MKNSHLSLYQVYLHTHMDHKYSVLVPHQGQELNFTLPGDALAMIQEMA